MSTSGVIDVQSTANFGGLAVFGGLIRLVDQSTPLIAPSDGTGNFYMKADGAPYWLGDTGGEKPLISAFESATAGTATAGTIQTTAAGGTDDSFVIGARDLDLADVTDDATILLYDVGKSALRVGTATAGTWDSTAIGLNSIAMGVNVSAGDNAFAFGDTPTALTAAAANQFAARATGGVQFFTDTSVVPTLALPSAADAVGAMQIKLRATIPTTFPPAGTAYMYSKDGSNVFVMESKPRSAREAAARTRPRPRRSPIRRRSAPTGPRPLPRTSSATTLISSRAKQTGIRLTL